MNISPIRFSDEFTPAQFRGRENPDAEFMVNFKNDNLVVGAIVKKENNNLIKHTMPEIYNPEKEIKKEQREIEKYTKAVERKDRELAVLRAEENYTEITTAAKYRKEYQTYIDRAVMRCEHLKKQAPELIAQSIEQAKLFINILDEEKKKAQAIIADAEKLKKQYEA